MSPLACLSHGRPLIQRCMELDGHNSIYSSRCGSSYGNLAWAADAGHAGNALVAVHDTSSPVHQFTSSPVHQLGRRCSGRLDAVGTLPLRIHHHVKSAPLWRLRSRRAWPTMLAWAKTELPA